MTAQQFKQKFSPLLPQTFPRNEGLQDSPFYIRLGVKMLKSVFPDWTADERRAFFVGHKNPKTKWWNFYGGLNSTYAESAICTLYKTIFTFLETGWWAMGLDKCNVDFRGLNAKKYVQETEFSASANVTFVQSSGIVFACIDDNWHYTCLLVQGGVLDDFVKVLYAQKYHTKFNSFIFSYDNLNFVGSTFSAVKPEQLIKKIIE